MHDPEDSAPKRSRLTIVLAEGDADQRFLLAAALRAGGHRVVETGNGEALLDYLRNVDGAPPDKVQPMVVVADLHLRGLNALAVFRELAAEKRRPRFVLLVPAVDQETLQAAMQLGAVAVVSKPFDFDDLRLLIRHLETKGGL